MKYLIMILIVMGLAVADFATGWIKAYVRDDLCSSKMRKGGLNKLCEVIVMCTACGLEMGLGLLGDFYQSPELAAVAGNVAAGAVFLYILAMEIVSILENFAAISPDNAWAAGIIRKLRNFDREQKN